MNNSVLKERLTYIDWMECIAIYFVIVYHSAFCSYNFLEDSKGSYYLIYLLRTILSTCVPMFFFVNGYLLFNKDFILKKHLFKTIKLVILAVVWGIITLLIFQVTKDEFFQGKREFLKALWEWRHGWIHHLWYMGALVCIYLFFPLLKLVYDTNKKVFVYFTIMCAIFTFLNKMCNQVSTALIYFIKDNGVTLNEFNFFNMFNPLRGIRGYSFVYFCVGGLVCFFKDKIEIIPKVRRNIFAIIGIVISAFGLFLTGILYSRASGEVWDVVWGGYDTIFTFCSVIFIYILCLNEEKDRTTIRTISCNTLGIYFIHWILIEFTYSSVKEIIVFGNVLGNLLYACMLLGGSLIISLFIKKIPVVRGLVN